MSAPRCLGLVGLVAAREDRDADGLAGPVRQHADATDHLVGVTRVDAEIDGDLDGLVELRRRALLHEGKRLVKGIELVAVDALAGSLDALSNLRHRLTP